MKELLLKQNYHWSGKFFDTGIERDVCGEILKSVQTRHVTAITGVRRCGKSYLFRQIIKKFIENGISPGNILQINFEGPYFIPRRNNPDVIEDIYREYLIFKKPVGRIYLFLDVLPLQYYSTCILLLVLSFVWMVFCCLVAR